MNEVVAFIHVKRLGVPMRIVTQIALVLMISLIPSSSSSQEMARVAPHNDWIGKSVAIARVGNRAMVPACPRLAQIDHFVRERSLKWDDASLGCRFMLAGNFTDARVTEVSGDYVRVTFTLTSFATKHTLWAPRRNLRLL